MFPLFVIVEGSSPVSQQRERGAESRCRWLAGLLHLRYRSSEGCITYFISRENIQTATVQDSLFHVHEYCYTQQNEPNTKKPTPKKFLSLKSQKNIALHYPKLKKLYRQRQNLTSEP